MIDTQINLGSQYKAYPVNRDRTPDRNSAVFSKSKTIAVESSIIPKERTHGIIVSVNYIQKQLDMILTHYPPFFPPGTYQRLDLIKKIRAVQEGAGKSSLSNELKKTLSDKKLQDNVSDKDISSALNKLFELRDKLTQKGLPTIDRSQHLSIKI